MPSCGKEICKTAMGVGRQADRAFKKMGQITGKLCFLLNYTSCKCSADIFNTLAVGDLNICQLVVKKLESAEGAGRQGIQKNGPD